MAEMSSSPPAERKILMMIESRLEHVSLVGMAVRGILKHAVPDDVAAYKIEVAVTEAVNNAVKHAYDLEGGHRVEIEMSLSPHAVIFRICDDGKSMQFPEKTDIKYDPDDLSRLPEGGMGIPLMKSIMDEVSYDRREGKNCLTLCKRL